MLHDDDGLIDQTTYADATTAGSSTAGNVAGYAQEVDELDGGAALADEDPIGDDLGAEISTTLYLKREAGGATIYPVASQSVYGDADGSDAQTTTYAYSSWDNLRPTVITTTQPTPTGGSAPVSTATFDDYGRVIATVDPDGNTASTEYDDASGGVTESVVGSATTTMEVDAFGRPTSVTDPNGNVTTYTYVNTDSESMVTVTPPTGPMQITDDNLSGGWMDTLTESSPGVLVSLTRNYLDYSGRALTTDVYTDLAEIYYDYIDGTVSPFGTQDINYTESTNTYDPVKGQDTSTDDLGNVTADDSNGLGETLAETINGTLLESMGYDNGNIGDGNMTSVTTYPDDSLAPRTTDTYNDWRDRQVATESGVGSSDAPDPISFDTLNNLGQVTEEQDYTGTGVTIAMSSDGDPEDPTSATLIGESDSTINSDGEDTQDEDAGVSPTTGLPTGTDETDNTSYDANGNVIATKSASGLWTKTTYNDQGQPYIVYTTDGAGDDPTSVTDDVVFTQQEFTYDADGNTILTTTRQRLSTDSTSVTGPLGGETSGVEASVDYTADYYDGSDRVTDQVDFGDDGGASFSRPSSAPSRSDVALVTHTDYDSSGNVQDTIDPRGIETYYTYDAEGQMLEQINAYTDGTPTDSTDQITAYTYDANGNTLTQTAIMPSGQPDQATKYVYGTGATENDVVKIEYPDATTGEASTSAADDVSYTYDNAGEKLTMTDQNGTTHQYAYDDLGRLLSDTVTTLGTGVDGTVMALGYTYTPQGQAYQQTSYNGSGGIVNQVQDVYDAFGDLTNEYQSDGGAVNTSTTPDVQYVYSGPSTGEELTEMIYPNGRILHYGYSDIGQVTYLADDNGSGSAGSHLVGYGYQGTSSIVTQAYGNGVTLTTTLDSYGRVTEMNYVNTSTSTSTDDFQYGYDRDGNVLYKNNVLNSSFSELYHANSTTGGDDNSAYDELSRLTAFSRGTLTSSGNNGSVLDTITTEDLNTLAGSSQSFALDAIGNQTTTTTDGTTTDKTQNSQNELTGVGDNTLIYDNDGNTTTDENGNTLTYDAWNRLATDSAGTTSYAYDADGRRITETHGDTATNLYFTTQGQVIEERQAGTVTAQNVWGVDYVDSLLVRDDNSASGSLGISGSGLGNRIYPQHDANHNITALVDASGAALQRAVYTPYGVPTILTGSWVTTTDAYSVPYGFQGGRLDLTTRLYFFNIGGEGRIYDPTTGVWYQKDRAGYVDGDSLYTGYRDNPVKYLDPRGTDVYIYLSSVQAPGGAGYSHVDIGVDVWDSAGNYRGVLTVGFFPKDLNLITRHLVPPGGPGKFQLTASPNVPPKPTRVIKGTIKQDQKLLDEMFDQMDRYHEGNDNAGWKWANALQKTGTFKGQTVIFPKELRSLGDKVAQYFPFGEEGPFDEWTLTNNCSTFVFAMLKIYTGRSFAPLIVQGTTDGNTVVDGIDSVYGKPAPTTAPTTAPSTAARPPVPPTASPTNPTTQSAPSK